MTLAKRFWAKIKKADGCWLWTAGRFEDGGKFRLGSKNRRAHRVAWEFTNGPIPAGMVVRHRCGVLTCVNPAHLSLGARGRPVEERFLAKVEKTETCWLWKGAKIRDGYGSLRVDGRSALAHRVAWELFRGPIPDGLTLDHLCRVRHCVNPDHLEVVTFRENVLRGNGVSAQEARRETCIHGHAFTPANTYRPRGSRQRRSCRACNAAAQHAYQARKTADQDRKRDRP